MGFNCFSSARVVLFFFCRGGGGTQNMSRCCVSGDGLLSLAQQKRLVSFIKEKFNK